MGKYGPLTLWFKTQTNRVVTLTFEAIEQIIAAKLPESARTYRPWWGNENSAESRQCKAWLSAGWHVESVDMVNGTVVFAR